MHMDNMPSWYWYILAFMVGASVGSFVSVCIERISDGRSIFYPPSHCPSCNRVIKWYDNIPILSYIVLKGKCRYCGAKIPFWYFLNELGMGVGYVIILGSLYKAYPIWICLIPCAVLPVIWVWVGLRIKNFKRLLIRRSQ